MSDSWREFERLRGCWLDTPSGKGGTIALSGFLYQFLVSLDALVERSADDAVSADIFLETLSDLTTVDERRIIATQVKSTMSSSAVSKALCELWSIHCTALAETPALVSQLSYRILARKPELKNVQASIARWGLDDEHDAVKLELFKAKVETSIDPDPELRLAQRLVSDFAVPDPFGIISKWLGDFLSDPSPQGLRRSCQKIATQLAAFRNADRERKTRFHIWSDRDHPPEIVELDSTDDAVLTGQIPKASDLSAGRFALRNIYKRIHHDAEEWLTRRGTDQRDLLDVFWISGRSGSGKSVALLHLLSALHTFNDGRTIIWLGSRAHKLAEAVNWAKPFFDQGREVIFAADDPFSAERQEGTRDALTEAEAALSIILRADSGKPRPAFFFCSPTEQLRSFQDRLGSQARVRPWPLAIDTHEDLEELRTWYRARTGREGLAVKEGEDVLLVQLFFEWATGKPIREFAAGLKVRLNGFMPDGKLFDLVAAILALNRIYANYPSRAIKAQLDADNALGTAFDQLETAEHHFAFDKDEPGCRIAHPHIANAIYISWFGEDCQWRYRKSHLHQGIAAALEYGEDPSEKYAPLWAIANLSRSASANENAEMRDLGRRFASIEQSLQEILPELYSSEFAARSAPLSALPVWANLNEELQLYLAPRPLDLIADAVSAANGHATGLRLSCHTLLNAYPEFKQGLPVVRDLLKRMPRWSEWHPVAASYLYKGQFDDIYDEVCAQICSDSERSHPIVFAVLSADSSADTRVSATEEDPNDGAKGGDQAVAKFARQKSITHLWLKQTQGVQRYAKRIIQAGLIRWPQDQTLLAAAWEFLDEFRDDSSWSYIWQALLACEADSARLENMARTWLQEQAVHTGGWDRVWEILWDRELQDDHDLREWAIRLLLAPDTHTSWTHIWTKLWRSSDKHDEQQQLAAVQWLERMAYDHPAWGYVWEDAWTDPGRMRKRFLDVGMDWLAKVLSHEGWAYVWKLVWETDPDDPDLRKITRSWLGEQGAHPSWQYVWEQPFAVTPDDPDLRTIARSWLGEQGAHPSWKYVWEKLFAVTPDDPDLRKIARSWLVEQGEHPSWNYVWDKCKTHRGSTDEHQRLQIGRNWIIVASYERADWGFVWRGLWYGLVSDTDRNWLATIGMTYLNSDKLSAASWPAVWRTVWDAGIGDTATLAAQADRLLAEKAPALTDQIRDRLREGRSPGAAKAARLDYRWKDDWFARWQTADSDKDALAIEARAWLGHMDLSQGGWQTVWRILWDDCSEGRPDASLDRSALKPLGFDWLGQVVPDHPHWSAVWLVLWRACGERDDQMTLADAAGAWLGGAGQRKDWPSVWLSLWEHEALRERLKAIAGLPERAGDLKDEDRAVIDAKLRS